MEIVMEFEESSNPVETKKNPLNILEFYFNHYDLN